MVCYLTMKALQISPSSSIKVTLAPSVHLQMRNDKGKRGGKAALSICHSSQTGNMETRGGEYSQRNSGVALVFFPSRNSTVFCEPNQRKGFSPLQLIPGELVALGVSFCQKHEGQKYEDNIVLASKACCSYCNNGLPQETLSAHTYWLVLVRPRGIKYMVRRNGHFWVNTWTDWTSEPTKSLN